MEVHGEPSGKDNPLIVVAEEKDTGAAVGFRGCVPTRLRAGDVVNAMYFADVMVHPDHIRHGLNTKMIDFSLTAFQDSPFMLYYYNFPRTLMHLGNIKKGVQRSMPRLRLLVSK